MGSASKWLLWSIAQRLPWRSNCRTTEFPHLGLGQFTAGSCYSWPWSCSPCIGGPTATGSSLCIFLTSRASATKWLRWMVTSFPQQFDIYNECEQERGVSSKIGCINHLGSKNGYPKILILARNTININFWGPTIIFRGSWASNLQLQGELKFSGVPIYPWNPMNFMVNWAEKGIWRYIRHMYRYCIYTT